MPLRSHFAILPALLQLLHNSSVGKFFFIRLHFQPHFRSLCPTLAPLLHNIFSSPNWADIRLKFGPKPVSLEPRPFDLFHPPAGWEVAMYYDGDVLTAITASDMLDLSPRKCFFPNEERNKKTHTHTATQPEATNAGRVRKKDCGNPYQTLPPSQGPGCGAFAPRDVRLLPIRFQSVIFTQTQCWNAGEKLRLRHSMNVCMSKSWWAKKKKSLHMKIEEEVFFTHIHQAERASTVTEIKL